MAMRVGADGDGSGVGAERLCGARRAEADGAEEDEHASHRVGLFNNSSALSSSGSGWAS